MVKLEIFHCLSHFFWITLSIERLQSLKDWASLRLSVRNCTYPYENPLVINRNKRCYNISFFSNDCKNLCKKAYSPSEFIELIFLSRDINLTEKFTAWNLKKIGLSFLYTPR